jgi:hypothetical protein
VVADFKGRDANHPKFEAESKRVILALRTEWRRKAAGTETPSYGPISRGVSGCSLRNALLFVRRHGPPSTRDAG